jgi:alanine racemase
MARLQIRIEAVRHNLRRLRAALAPSCRVMLVCKSDFYGLGLDLAAALEKDVDLFAVNSLAEARRLAGITVAKGIVVLYPPTIREDLLELLAAAGEDPRIVPTVLPTPEHADCLGAMESSSGLSTGTGARSVYVLWPQLGDRFWSAADSEAVLADLAGRPGLAVRGVFTHIAEAHGLNDAEIARRIDGFAARMRRLCPGVALSVADSHLAGRGLGTQLDFCRVGLYPLGVIEPKDFKAHGLRTALRLTARAVNGYVLPAPARIGYGPQVVGAGEAVSILDVGFASGLPFDFFRHCQAVGPGGETYRFLGQPWMEYSAILTGKQPLPPGTEVELFGDRLAVADQGERAGLPPEDLFCHLGRVPREIVSQ